MTLVCEIENPEEESKMRDSTKKKLDKVGLQEKALNEVQTLAQESVARIDDLLKLGEMTDSEDDAPMQSEDSA